MMMMMMLKLKWFLFFCVMMLHYDVVLAQNATEAPVDDTPPATDNGETMEPTMMNATMEDLGDKPTCFEDTELLDKWIKQKDPFVVESYILCANTVFEIGFPDSEGVCCVDGTPPIELRRNMRVSCGQDGKSTNNCVVKGGQFHVIANAPSFDFEVKDNAVVQGVTFENGASAGALLVSEGTYTFIDCIFKLEENIGAITLLFYVERGRRTLQELQEISDGKEYEEEEEIITPKKELGETINYYANIMSNPDALEEYRTIIAHRKDMMRSSSRSLQAINPDGRQVVSFDGCQFLENKAGPRTPATNYGIIHAETDTNNVTVKNSIFNQNNFVGDGISESYAIFIRAGSNLAVENNCFVNNQFTGRGVVNIEQEIDLLSHVGNHGEVKAAGLACEFISIGTGKNDMCIDYSSTTCIPDPALTVERKPDDKDTSNSPSVHYMTSLLLSLILGTTTMMMLLQ